MIVLMNSASRSMRRGIADLIDVLRSLDLDRLSGTCSAPPAQATKTRVRDRQRAEAATGDFDDFRSSG